MSGRAAIHLLAGNPGHGPGRSDKVLLHAVRAIGKVTPTIAYIGCASGESTPFRLFISKRLESAEVFPCLNLAPVYCDTHDEEAGWVELLALLRLLPPGSEGWGIPSGGDLVAGPGAGVTWTGPPPARYLRNAEGTSQR